MKTHHAQWALGASATLASLGSAQAALVKVDLNHDLTTTLNGLDFGEGLGSDAGQWISVNVYKTFLFQLVGGGVGRNYAFQDSATTFALAGTDDIGVEVFDRGVVSGLIAWDLADGTEGWLHVSFHGDLALTDANYFAFDDAAIGVTGGRTAGNLDHGGDAEAFASAPNYTAVPEPSSLALLALGAAGVMGRRRR